MPTGVKPSAASTAVQTGNPLVTNLVAVVPFVEGSGTAKEYISNALGTLGSSSAWVSGTYGPHVDYPGNSLTGGISFGVFQPVTGASGLTIMVLANPISETRASVAVSQRIDSGSQIGLVFNANAGFSDVAGSMVLYQTTTSGNINGTAASGIISSGNFAWYGATSTGVGGTTKYYRDGVELHSSANSFNGGVFERPTQEFVVGKPGGWTFSSYGVSCDVVAVFVWDVALTQTEIDTFLNDPWALITAAGGANTNKALAGAITIAGQIARGIGKGTGGSLTPSATLGDTLGLSKSVSGSSTPSGSLQASTVLAQFLSGTLTASGVLRRGISKLLGGLIGSTGGITKGTAKQLAGQIGMAGTIAKGMAIALAGVINGVGTLVTQYNPFVPGSGIGAKVRYHLRRFIGRR